MNECCKFIKMKIGEEKIGLEKCRFRDLGCCCLWFEKWEFEWFLLGEKVYWNLRLFDLNIKDHNSIVFVN